MASEPHAEKTAEPTVGPADALARAPPSGQPLAEVDTIAAKASALGVDGVPVAAVKRDEEAASAKPPGDTVAVPEASQEAHAEHSGHSTVVVVAADAGAVSAAAFRNAAEILDKAKTHFHIVHVRHAPGTPQRPCTQLAGRHHSARTCSEQHEGNLAVDSGAPCMMTIDPAGTHWQYCVVMYYFALCCTVAAQGVKNPQSSLLPAEETLFAPISEGFNRYDHQLERKHQRESKEVLDRFEHLAKKLGVHHVMVELKAKNGDPREALCKYCTEKKAGLLVLGSRGTGPAQRCVSRHELRT